MKVVAVLTALTATLAHGAYAPVDTAAIQRNVKSGIGLNQTNSNPFAADSATGSGTNMPGGAALGGTNPAQDMLKMSGIGGLTSSIGKNGQLKITMQVDKDVPLKCDSGAYRPFQMHDVWVVQAGPCSWETEGTKQRLAAIPLRFCYLDRTAGGGCSNPAMAGAWMPANAAKVIQRDVPTELWAITEPEAGTNAVPGKITISWDWGKNKGNIRFQDIAYTNTTQDKAAGKGQMRYAAQSPDSSGGALQSTTNSPKFNQALDLKNGGSTAQVGVNLEDCVSSALAGAGSADGKVQTCNGDAKQKKTGYTPMITDFAKAKECKDAYACLQELTTTQRWNDSCTSPVDLVTQSCKTEVPVKECLLYRGYDYKSCKTKRVVTCTTTKKGELTFVGPNLLNYEGLGTEGIKKVTMGWHSFGGAAYGQGELTWTFNVPNPALITSFRALYINTDDAGALLLNGQVIGFHVPGTAAVVGKEGMTLHMVGMLGTMGGTEGGHPEPVQPPTWQKLPISGYPADQFVMSYAFDTGNYAGVWTNIDGAGGGDFAENQWKQLIVNGTNTLTFRVLNGYRGEYKGLFGLEYEMLSNPICTSTLDRSACAEMDAVAQP